MNKVNTKHQSENGRKNRLLLTSSIVLIPAVLFLIFWAHEKRTNNENKWELGVFLAGIILIALGCLEILIYEIIFKSTKTFNIFGALLCGLGGILYLIAAIGMAVDLANHKDILGIAQHLDEKINTNDAIYWFGIYSLIGLDALLLAVDCTTNLIKECCASMLWANPLALTTAMVFSYLVHYHDELTWWETTGAVGFGIVAVISCLFSLLVRIFGSIASICAFIGSILIWIFYCAILDYKDVDGHVACLYIGISFLISAQTLFLLHDCSLHKRVK